ncbi:MAG: hypothetical protein WBO10_01445 [Pyrinomonadaceae bacterium]
MEEISLDHDFADDLLDLALKLATEWGDNFRKPIDDRVRETHPDLTDADMERLTAIVKQAESYIYSLAEDQLAGTIAESEIISTARDRFPWLGTDNASRLKNIGMYYAHR